MYLIGIDISKYKHDCFITTETGAVVKNAFSFNNDSAGFNEFIKIIQSLDPLQEKRIGLESTGHYGTNLKIFLHEHNLSFMEFNPILTERYREVSSLRKTKNDKIDAELISKMLLTYDYKPNSLKSYHILKLKSLTRFRKVLVKNRSIYIVRLINILDIVFPEYQNFFTQLQGALSLYILKNFPSKAKIASININKTYPEVKKLSRNHYSLIKFMKLIDAAKNSIGSSEDIYNLELPSVISFIELYDSQINLVENKIISIMNQYDFKTLSIPGIGIISAASIVSEYGDFNNFSNPNKMLSFAGLDNSLYSSGTITTYGHLVKRGSTYLRETIMNVAETVVKYNATFAAFYDKKRNEGKPHLVCLTHVAKKLIRIIYKLETTNTNFDPFKIQ